MITTRSPVRIPSSISFSASAMTWPVNRARVTVAHPSPAGRANAARSG
ncbi:MAG TPA: hypothetical protein VFV67_30200 [Actinophytocola sp.]|nr:hypothetical protein [Actinophytocola sp.]HEU5474936.1 hypothetical protein [Actinophytocola sp.]